MMKKNQRFYAMLSLVLVFSILFSNVPVALAQAREEDSIGTNYYIDSVGGDDAANGTAPATAWKTLAKLNAHTFGPGDKVLFKQGTTYNGQFKPLGSGTKENPISIDVYDGDTVGLAKGGSRAVLAGGGTTMRGVLFLYNVQYWNVNNLEITNKAANHNTKLLGLNVEIDQPGVFSGYHLNNLYVHDVTGTLTDKDRDNGGILFAVTADKNFMTGKVMRFNDVIIENCDVRDVSRTAISMGWTAKDADSYGYSGVMPQEMLTNYWHTNVVIRNNYVARSGGDAIVPMYCIKPIIEYNVGAYASQNTKDNPSAMYNANIWPWRCEDAVFQFNEAYGTVLNGDGMSFDCDSSRGTVYQYNYSHDNDGGFMLVCQNESIDGVVRYNISQNDKRDLFLLSNSGVPDARKTVMYNNTFYLSGNTGIVAGSGKIDLKNNIFYNDGTNKSPNWGNSQAAYNTNLYYGFHTTPSDANKITADPLLVDPGKGGTGTLGNSAIDTLDGYKLQQGSPAINAGAAIENNGGRDYFGTTLSDGAVDIGAVEYVAGSKAELTKLLAAAQEITTKLTQYEDGAAKAALPGIVTSAAEVNNNAAAADQQVADTIHTLADAISAMRLKANSNALSELLGQYPKSSSSNANVFGISPRSSIIPADAVHDTWKPLNLKGSGNVCQVDSVDGKEWLQVKCGSGNDNTTAGEMNYVNETAGHVESGFFETKIRVANGDPKVGVYLRHTGVQKGVFVGYDKSNWFWQIYDGSANDYAPITTTVPAQGTVSTLRLEFNGDKLQIYINGTKMVTDLDISAVPNTASGKFAIKNGSSGSQAYFTDMRYSGQTDIPVYTVSGVVSDDAETPAPVEGAVVQLGSLQTTTNALGAYTFTDNVRAGDYTLVVSKKGYTSVTTPLFTVGADAENKNVTLPKTVPPPDKSTLEYVLGLAKSHNANSLVPSMKELYTRIMDASAALNESPAATQQQIDSAWKDVFKVMHALDFVPGNKTALSKALDDLQDLVLSDYEDGQKKDAFTQASEKAELLLANDDAMEADIVLAVTALTNAKDDMIFKVADTARLQELYSLHKNKSEKDYYAAQWGAFQAALENAGALLTSTVPVSQSAVEAAKKLLETTAAALVERAATDAEKTALQDLYDNNADKLEADYTADSWSGFQKAMAKTKAVLEQAAPTRILVNKTLTDLKDALNKLVEKPSENPVIVTDPESGITVRGDAGVIPADTVLVVTPVKQGEKYDMAKEALAKIAQNFALFDFSLESKGVTIEPNGAVQVSVPIPQGYDSSRLELYRISENGEKVKLSFTVVDGKIVFTTDHFSLYALVQTVETDTSKPEDTVPSGDSRGMLPAGLLLVALSASFALILVRKRECKS